MQPLSPIRIAALLHWLDGQNDFVFLDCARVSGEDHRSFLFIDSLQWLVCTDPWQAKQFLAEADALRHKGYFLAGWLGYEFGYLLEPSLFPLSLPEHVPFAVLGVFEKPIVIDHQADSQAVLDQLVKGGGTRSEQAPTIENLRTNIRKDEYLDAVNRIKDYIVAGDTYQVNYTLKLQFDFNGTPSGLYTSLRRNQAVSYGAWIRQGGRDIMSFSPELFFRADQDRIRVRPMKGTMKRGRNTAEDELQKKILHNDIKNRSENVMIVDLLRNDLGRLLHTTSGGMVQPRSLFDVETYDTLLQMTSTIDGIPSGSTLPGLQQIVSALFPCGSVTGAPKIRTMEIINELEREPRGVYCGAIGFSELQESVFNVPIRTVVLDGKRGEMGIGSGIVFDSDPEAEWQESLLKGEFLTHPQPDFQLIETLLWLPGSGYWLFKEHIERLADSATFFLFIYEKEKVVGLLEREAQALTSATRVRLLLHRDGSVYVTSMRLDSGFQPVLEPLVNPGPLPKVVVSNILIDPDNLYFYHKTTQRQLYIDERKLALDAGFHEVLFVNRDGEVTEGSISNVFLLMGGRLLTPPVSCGLLGGTFRRFLVARGAASEQIVTMNEVRKAEAVYVGNSVRGLVQVEVVDGLYSRA